LFIEIFVGSTPDFQIVTESDDVSGI